MVRPTAVNLKNGMSYLIYKSLNWPPQIGHFNQIVQNSAKSCFWVLSLERISDMFANCSRKKSESTSSTPPNLKKGHQILAASPPILRAGFLGLEGWNAFSHSCFSRNLQKHH